MKLLFVCLGNICRSPTAHGIMEGMLQQRGINWVAVDSAGTAAYHIGKEPDNRSQKAAREQHYDLSGLRARQVSESDFFEFDYIFAMDQSNLNNLQSMQPASSSALVELALARTSLSMTEVPDPYYGGDSGFNDVVSLCETICESIIDQIIKEKS